MGERCIQGFDGDLMERDHLEDLDLEGRIILRQISKSGMGRHGLHLSGSG
jgi:hypothetical protein